MGVPLRLSIVVPVRDGEPTLGDALKAILASELRREEYELIVVDDGSTDNSASVAARYADTVVRLRGGPCGPAYARNRGTELASADTLAFVDADVRVQPDTLLRMLAVLDNQPTIDAVSASYDETPAAGDFVSQYWNLLLLFGEQRHSAVSSCFSSACGAIRRAKLISSGMYDEWRFETACLEGLELGQRLKRNGYGILAGRDLRVTHMKRWSLGSVFREVWNRSELLARSLGYRRTHALAPSDVVFTLSRSLIPALGLVATVGLTAAFIPHPHWAMNSAIAIAVMGLANLEIHRFYARMRGLAFAVAVAPLHLSAQLFAVIALGTGRLLRSAVGDHAPDAKTQAYAEVGLETWPPVPRQL